MGKKCYHKKHAGSVNDVLVQSLRFFDGQPSWPDPVRIVETIHFSFLLALDTNHFVPNPTDGSLVAVHSLPFCTFMSSCLFEPKTETVELTTVRSAKISEVT